MTDKKEPKKKVIDDIDNVVKDVSKDIIPKSDKPGYTGLEIKDQD